MKAWDITMNCTVTIYGVRGEDLDQALDNAIAKVTGSQDIMPEGIYIDILEGICNSGAKRWYTYDEEADDDLTFIPAA